MVATLKTENQVKTTTRTTKRHKQIELKTILHFKSQVQGCKQKEGGFGHNMKPVSTSSLQTKILAIAIVFVCMCGV